jgi:hypothetical protein
MPCGKTTQLPRPPPEKNPFELVYGLEARLPINLHIPALQIAQQFVTDKEALQGKIDQLMELDETRRMAFDQMEKNQEKVKGTFDRKARKRDFKKGDQVLRPKEAIIRYVHDSCLLVHSIVEI